MITIVGSHQFGCTSASAANDIGSSTGAANQTGTGIRIVAVEHDGDKAVIQVTATTSRRSTEAVVR
ncbi:hypothetical protein KPL76_12910 [Subtercola sp. PAMC28395]|uniref:hypothetical protein n=1 Tax=Subtercola sp. PAMC28395 TaxID=2846775 RepID=UPI001C0DC14E|nr:hypothetical protein [Subtercola sp. PAMC28395]QWT23591.1 hypothetical protein KPL76_12910 [Subtercola sp. PAMC28395]